MKISKILHNCSQRSGIYAVGEQNSFRWLGRTFLLARTKYYSWVEFQKLMGDILSPQLHKCLCYAHARQSLFRNLRWRPFHCRAYVTGAQLKNWLYRSIELQVPGYGNSQLHFHRLTIVVNNRTDECCPHAIQTHHTPILPTRVKYRSWVELQQGLAASTKDDKSWSWLELLQLKALMKLIRISVAHNVKAFMLLGHGHSSSPATAAQ